MQQDQKIGLALAVLLIGFAGAFCFRHEGVIKHSPQALNRAEELDQRISHLPVRAYIEREGVRLPGGGTRGPRPVAPDGPLSEVFDHALTWRSDDPEGAPAGNVIGPFPGPPEPLRVVQDYRPIRPMLNIEVESAVPRFRSDSGRQSVPMRPEDPPPHWEEGRGPPPTAPSSSVPVAAPRGNNADAAMPTYVVRSGDTLSGLAKRFLGSTHLYRELYDENRDVLSDPDRLREGMVLRIPHAR